MLFYTVINGGQTISAVMYNSSPLLSYSPHFIASADNYDNYEKSTTNLVVEGFTG